MDNIMEIVEAVVAKKVQKILAMGRVFALLEGVRQLLKRRGDSECLRNTYLKEMRIGISK